MIDRVSDEHRGHRPAPGGGPARARPGAQYQSTAWLWPQALQGLPYTSWM